MFKDNSINLTYKRPQLPETSDRILCVCVCVLGGTWGEQKQFTVVMSRCSTPVFESEIIDRFSKITAQTYQNEYL